MATTPDPQTLTPWPISPDSGPAPADQAMAEVTLLLQQLQEASQSHAVLPPVINSQLDNQLVQVRLGTAASLFAALQCKHAATAGHALRVALTSSAWALRMGLDASLRDVLEVAALLHDIGVIGVPDHVLLKPADLTAPEKTIMLEARQMSLDILQRSCASAEILEIVEYVPAWFNGSLKGFSAQGRQIPVGARMIAIVEAFDAMTTDHVYRPALALENAMVELFQCAGSQFDPELVRQFAEYHLYDQTELHREVATRWLRTLDPQVVNSYWQLNCVPSPNTAHVDTLFQAKLMDNMHDGVVFIDAGMRVLAWNHGAERLTGASANDMRQRRWQSDLLDMCDEMGRLIKDADCPVRGAIQSGVQSLRRMTIRGRGERPVAVDTHTIPVAAEGGAIVGAVLLLHDASSEISLEHRCQTLYDKSTKDPLTQVANRAEFDRVLSMFVAAHREQHVPCAMMICDLDHFKQVNDTYGHPAGDEAIKSLANLLKTSCRPGDLVARYGGEEFVMLYADCDNATAARRAEQIRIALSQTPQSMLEGRSITASFGVTEIQPGDTPETMLRRADRGLLQAKGKGRNTVVQLGGGAAEEPAEAEPRRFSLFGRRPADPEIAFEQELITSVPIQMTIEKLRGFVADHEAKILGIDGNNVRLEVSGTHPAASRRRSDRPVDFAIDLRFEEERVQRSEEPEDRITRTRIHVLISPRKSRDRRVADLEEQAGQVLASFRAYLMAALAGEEPTGGILRRVKRILAPWMTKR